MSTPHPEGLGAERALDDALARAGVAADRIDHINLHGTASAKNDEVEAALVARRFPARTHAVSTKGTTGHTLGAAGIVEARRACSRSSTASCPGMAGTRTLDPACGPQIRVEPARGDVRLALSNSFGFGGNNCVLVLGASVEVPRMTALDVPGRGHRLLGADAARLVDRARGVPRRGEAGRSAGQAPAPEILAPAERRARPTASPSRSRWRARGARGRPRRGDAALGLHVGARRPRGQRLHVRDPGDGSRRRSRRRASTTRCTTPRRATGRSPPGCRAASSALTAFDASFAAGLLEAATHAPPKKGRSLLVAFERGRRSARSRRDEERGHARDLRSSSHRRDRAAAAGPVGRRAVRPPGRTPRRAAGLGRGAERCRQRDGPYALPSSSSCSPRAL
jgi:hypothetical protein